MATTSLTDVVMPQMGVSVSEGTIVRWLKQEGEPVEADETLLEISTDKVDTEVPSPARGVLQQILVPEGETVAVGTRIGTIAPAGAEAPAAAPPSSGAATTAADAAPARAGESAAAEPEAASAGESAAAEPETTAPAAQPADVPAPPAAVAPEQHAQEEPPLHTDSPYVEPQVEDGEDESAKAFVSPVVARIAAEHGVEVGSVEGSGHGGRVTKKDILAFIDSGAQAKPQAQAPPAEEAPAAAQAPVAPPPAPAAPPPAAPAAPTPATPAPQPVGQAEALPGETIESMTPMRRGIAEHMRRSLDTSAHVTTVFEIDMSKVAAIRERLKGPYEESHGVRLTYLAFIARATVEALGNWPWLNGEIRGDRIVSKRSVNLAIAVALEGGKGLIVPVIKNAEGLNLLGLARGIQDVAERARSKRLLPDDVVGGSFTITNPGGWGAIMGTPIINQPQVGILDVEAIVKRPVVVADELGNDVLAIRPMMNLCLSYDHRLVDGAYAAQFMKELRESLERWDEERY
jgi:pyruvate dehydrogenase E2 component (dihydrolipoamide acetyltransferase)